MRDTAINVQKEIAVAKRLSRIVLRQLEGIGDINRFRSLGELTAEIYRSIYYYNNERIHTSLGTAPRKFARQSQINYNQNQEKLAV